MTEIILKESENSINLNKYKVSINDTHLLWKVPANWILLIVNLALPIYLFTENLFLTIFIIGSYYFYGYKKTKMNQKWTEEIRSKKVFSCFLGVYILFILALFAKIYFL
jgi:hypothetical protein